jgi:hypothetical protein
MPATHLPSVAATSGWIGTVNTARAMNLSTHTS